MGITATVLRAAVDANVAKGMTHAGGNSGATWALNQHGACSSEDGRVPTPCRVQPPRGGAAGGADARAHSGSTPWRVCTHAYTHADCVRVCYVRVLCASAMRVPRRRLHEKLGHC